MCNESQLFPRPQNYVNWSIKLVFVLLLWGGGVNFHELEV